MKQPSVYLKMRVLGAIDRGQPVVYAPGIWRWVMCVMRALPRSVVRRLRV